MTSTSIATEPAPKMKGTTGEMERSIEEAKPAYIVKYSKYSMHIKSSCLFLPFACENELTLFYNFAKKLLCKNVL